MKNTIRTIAAILLLGGFAACAKKTPPPVAPGKNVVPAKRG